MFGNNKPFGTASAFGTNTFGNTSTPFGQSTTGFGAKPATSNVFGSTGFGVQTQATPMSGGLFGTSTPTSGTGLFGQSTTAFGAPASTSTTGFGGFGATSTSGGLFGNTTPSTQSTGGLFGATSTSAFGTPRPAFGGFGTTNTGSGLFGQSNTTGTGLFGSTGGFNAAAPTGTTIKFNPPTGTDTMMKGGVSTSIGTRHQCITCMKEYENKSLEELRVEDYAANRKGGSNPGIGFGTPTQQTSGGLFGGSTAASTSGFSFGNTTQSKPLFGTTGMTNTFGSTSLFGQPTQNQSTGLFGKSVGFGAPSTSTAPAFSFGGQNNTSLFGQNNQQKPLFGQTTGTTGLFGNTATTQATGFGTNTGFGGFGATNQQSTGLFGAKPTGFGTTNTTTTSTFSFGNANTMAGGGLFGQKSTAPTFGTTGFGTQTSGFGGFGTTQSTGTNLFGQNKPATTGFGGTGTMFGGGLGSTFGTPSTFSMGLGSNTGTGLFGASTANKAPGFSFGNTNTSGFNFGSTNPSNSSFSFGGTSSMMPSGDPNNSAALQQIQQQIFAMTANPFGDSPLFRNSIKDSSREAEVLKPTNPSAQKALLNDSHYKVDLLPTAKIKPKPWSPASNGKVFLFDGLEDEEPSLGAAAFVPKKSVKKLVLKNIGNSNSSLTFTSDVSSNNPTRIDVSISLKGYQNVSQKSPESANRDAPLTSDVTNITKENSTDKALVSGDSGKLSLTNKMSPVKAASSPDSAAKLNTSLNDSIAELHTNKPKYVGQTYNIWNDSNEEASDARASLEESLNTSTDGGSDQKFHPTGIVLSKSLYYTIPTLEEMISMLDENKACLVNNFTIGRKGYGKVMFPGVTNVAGLNLDEIVCFQKKEVTVYPDDDRKPPVGEGLNKRAEVTLENVWPTDKTTHEPIKDPMRLEKLSYREKIINSTIKLGAKFIDYIPETGSWIFEVEHFSKYGLEDSDEEIEELDVAKSGENKAAVPKNQIVLTNGFFPKDAQSKPLSLKPSNSLPLQDQEMEAVPSQMQPQYMDFVNDNSLLTDFAGPMKPIFNNAIDAERIQGMKASFFEEDMEEDIFVSPLYTGKKDLFLHQNKEIDLYATPSYHSKLHDSAGNEVLKKLRYLDPDSDRSSFSSIKKPAEIGIQKSLSSLSISAEKQPDWLLNLPIVKSSSQILPISSKPMLSIHKIFLKPFKESVLYGKQHLFSDAGYFMGRRFKVGWSADGIFSCLDTPQEDKTDSLQKLLYSALKAPNRTPHQKPGFIVSLKKAPSLIAEPDYCKKIEKNLVDVFGLQLKYSVSTVDEGVPLFVPKPGIESIHELANLFEHQLKDVDPQEFEIDYIRQCVFVWDLLVSLWGKVRGLDTDENVSNFATQMGRREALSRWLIKATERDLTKRIADISEDEYLKKIFFYLSGRRTKDAINTAQKHRDFRMSLLLSQAESACIVRKLIGKQLLNWNDNDACKFISYDRIVLYTLLSGLLVWEHKYESVNCYQNLNWKQALSLQLWYHCNPNSSIQEAITEYDLSFQEKYSMPPYPPYLDIFDLDSKDQEAITEYDTCYHLLKLYCDRSHRFDLLLMPETYSSDHLDYRLSWFLHLALSSIGYNVPLDLSTTIHLNFASQLESLDLWHWAIFVVLHHPDAAWRIKFVKDILLRHVTLERNKEMSERENFVVESLLVPSAWIYEAKAVKANNFGNKAEEAWYLLKAGSWSKSHSIVIKHLASSAVINEDYEYLMTYLDELSPPERSCTIQDWCSGGQVYLDYIHMCKVVQEVLSLEASAYDLEKFTPEVVSLCKRLSSIPVLSLEDSLSVAEMAKKTATILRSISILQASRTKNSSCLTMLTQSLKNLPMPYDYAVPENRFVAHCFMDAITAGY